MNQYSRFDKKKMFPSSRGWIETKKTLPSSRGNAQERKPSSRPAGGLSLNSRHHSKNRRTDNAKKNQKKVNNSGELSLKHIVSSRKYTTTNTKLNNNEQGAKNGITDAEQKRTNTR